MMVLHHGWRSSASRRVRLCLAEKGLDYESHIVDMVRGDQHSAAYLAMNPNGVVPTLLHDGKVLYESGFVAEYLDEVFPQPPLRPADPYARLVMRNFVRWVDEKVLPKIIVFNWSMSMQPTASGWSEADLAERLARVPSAERREAWTRVARKPYTEEEKAEAMRGLVALLDKMDGLLAAAETQGSAAQAADGPWLVAGLYSIADIAATPFVMRISELNPAAIAERPRVAGWWARVQARPAFKVARIESYAGSLEEERAAKAVAA